MATPLPIGTRRLNHNGYVRIRTADGWRFEHRVVWESVHGPVPAGCVVHHRNHDRTDNRLDNLECCASNSAHIREHHADHSRAQALKNAEALRGIPRTEEHKAKMRKPKARPMSAEHRAKIAAARRGTRASPETRAKLSAMRAGRSLSDAHRAAIADGLRGKPKSDAHRAKLAEATRRYAAEHPR